MNLHGGSKTLLFDFTKNAWVRPKLKGGREMAPTVKAIVDAGISVRGYIGMMLQTGTKLSGDRVRGQDVAAAKTLIEHALALEDAGVFSMVLTTIPSPLAKLITVRVSIPTIGIGAGPDCDGQVLFLHNLVGFFDRPVSKHFKKYANVFSSIVQALSSYRYEKISGAFPGPEHGYDMSKEALQALQKELGE